MRSIFAALRDMAGVPADEILHIGDDPITDVVGARQAGMQTAWLNRDRAQLARRSRAACAHHFDARGNYLAPSRRMAPLAAYDTVC